jgi:non-specific serine/threonine protein kinase
LGKSKLVDIDFTKFGPNAAPLAIAVGLLIGLLILIVVLVAAM